MANVKSRKETELGEIRWRFRDTNNFDESLILFPSLKLIVTCFAVGSSDDIDSKLVLNLQEIEEKLLNLKEDLTIRSKLIWVFIIVPDGLTNEVRNEIKQIQNYVSLLCNGYMYLIKNSKEMINWLNNSIRAMKSMQQAYLGKIDL
ncbi:MAG: hypothetical protein MHMPM18_002578 [Marteilia pararefringens]